MTLLAIHLIGVAAVASDASTFHGPRAPHAKMDVVADVVLFHHVMGVTSGVGALADDLRTAGHTVKVPDLFEGHRFDSIAEGAQHVDEIGFSTILERGRSAVESLADGLVYAGISLGAVPAQALAQTRRGAAAAVLFEACVPPTEFGDGWPAGVSLQVHGMVDDPFFGGEGDLDAARALVAASPDDAELFEYAGDQHLFVDRSLRSYEPRAASLAIERTLALLHRLDGV